MCVWVYVGSDDGAQAVVKDILEDVVTSAVKGKNQGQRGFHGASFLQNVLGPVT